MTSQQGPTKGNDPRSAGDANSFALGDLPVAVDAMGGDKAPSEIVKGALEAASEGLRVVLVGPKEKLGEIGDLEVIEASEVIAMDEDPARAARQKKDSSLVKAANAVKEGKASAMVSAGNTGAAMASALLRMGRIKGVQRPAIATPIPGAGTHPTVLLDAGANAECTASMLVQFAQMGAAFASQRYGIDKPRVGLLSIGEESSKGTPLVREVHELLAGGSLGAEASFVGNVEGRDVMTGVVDVVVTDGFTGNVTLKSLEGAMKFFMETLLRLLGSTSEARQAAEVILPLLAPEAERLHPDTTGGAMLLGVEGLCVISHGSSGATAIKNAIRVAHDLAAQDLVGKLRASIGRG